MSIHHLIRTKPRTRVKLVTLKERFLGGNLSLLSFSLFVVLSFINFCSVKFKKINKNKGKKYMNKMLAPQSVPHKYGHRMLTQKNQKN